MGRDLCVFFVFRTEREFFRNSLQCELCSRGAHDSSLLFLGAKSAPQPRSRIGYSLIPYLPSTSEKLEMDCYQGSYLV